MGHECLLFRGRAIAALLRETGLPEERPGGTSGSGETVPSEGHEHGLVTRRRARFGCTFSRSLKAFQRISNPSLARAVRICSRPFIDLIAAMRFRTLWVHVVACISLRAEN